jgi:phage recombination protein Bet
MSTAVANNGASAPSEKDRMEIVPFMSKEPIILSCHIVQTMICVPTKSGHVCDARQALRFMMLCKARSLNPFEGDAFLIGYDTKDGPQFSLITAHQAFLKRAETHPEYDGMESGVIVKAKDGFIFDRDGDFTLDDDTLIGGWATVFFKNRSHPNKKRLKLSTFRKPYGRWNDDPAGMIVKCAEADALRSSFPTMLGGMYLEDELPGAGVFDASTLTRPSRVTRSDLNAQIAGADPEAPFVHQDPVSVDEPADPGPDDEIKLHDQALALGCPDAEIGDWLDLAMKESDPAAYLAGKPWAPKKQKSKPEQGELV